MTHTAPLLNIPATHKQVRITGMTFARAANGKLVEGWNNWDELGLLKQIGVIPSTEKALANEPAPMILQ
jgi:predicted ester cyclase